MKFLYEYQDKANKRHSGTLRASTRAAAYAALKAQGIKPIRCDAAPGLINAIVGKGKRWLAIGVLVCIVGIAGSLYLRATRDLNSVESSETFRALRDIETSTTRRQLVGDAAVIEKGIRTGWKDVFSDEGERFLASYAVPGYFSGLRSTSEEVLKRTLELSDLSPSPSKEDSLEARQIRAMVKGMKDELRRFIANGGTIVEYGQRLVARQETEIKYFNIAQKDLEVAIEGGKSEAEVMALWERHNASLRKMGIRTVPCPLPNRLDE